LPVVEGDVEEDPEDVHVVQGERITPPRALRL
jgi:hypothetical protein